MSISPSRIAEIVNNRRRIAADTALGKSLYFGNSPEFWMNLQTHHDLKIAKRNLDAKDIRRIKGSTRPLGVASAFRQTNPIFHAASYSMSRSGFPDWVLFRLANIGPGITQAIAVHPAG